MKKPKIDTQKIHKAHKKLGKPKTLNKAQLEKFRDGNRGNEMNAMKRDIAKKMTDEDIEVLSKYVGGLH